MKHITVTAAIIIYNDKILCLQRPENKYDYISYKFEFPGGKVEEGESFQDSLSREIKEELDMDIEVKEEDFFMTVEHEYPDFRITMHSYRCLVDQNDFTMKEHIDFRWLGVEELKTLDWAGADVPIVERIVSIRCHKSGVLGLI